MRMPKIYIIDNLPTTNDHTNDENILEIRARDRLSQVAFDFRPLEFLVSTCPNRRSNAPGLIPLLKLQRA